MTFCHALRYIYILGCRLQQKTTTKDYNKRVQVRVQVRVLPYCVQKDHKIGHFSVFCLWGLCTYRPK